MTVLEIEVRCPVGPRRLFAKIVAEGGRPKIVEGNLIEFACSDCRRLRRLSGEPVTLVLHRYDLAGQLVETEVLQ